MKTSLAKAEIIFIVVGVLFVLAGLLALVVFMSPGKLDSLSPRVDIAFWIISIGLIGWGVITIFWRKKSLIINGNLVLISLLVITPIAGELFIRTAIALNVEFFRNPHFYASWIDDDDLWKLRHQWDQSAPQLEGGGFVVDPLLGWAPEKTPQNPLGILAEQPYNPDFTAKTILFYGDSYVYGMSPTPINQRIPQQLDRLLPDYTVYNYGVVGYGLDQILLRFQETHPDFETPFVIVGTYTLDIDRALLKVREAPKPYFEIKDEQLALMGVPVEPDMETWLEQHPLTIKSYFLAFMVRTSKIMAGGFQPTEMSDNRQEKEVLGAKIIESIVNEAQTHELPLLWVIFYREEEFGYEGWREIFLQDLLTRLDIPYIDTKELFQQQAELRAVEISAFYDPRHDHFNELGSQVVAEAIVVYIEKYESEIRK